MSGAFSTSLAGKVASTPFSTTPKTTTTQSQFGIGGTLPTLSGGKISTTGYNTLPGSAGSVYGGLGATSASIPGYTSATNKVPEYKSNYMTQPELLGQATQMNRKAPMVGGYSNVVPSRVQTMGADRALDFAMGTDYGAKDAVQDFAPNMWDTNGGVNPGKMPVMDAVQEARMAGATKPTWNPNDPRNAVLNAYNQ